MTVAEISFGRSMLASADVTDAVYLPVPVSTGLREVQLMQRLGITTREELRSRFTREYEREVFQANLDEAEVLAARVRRLLPTRTVINPGSFSREGWSQDDYRRFWLAVLSSNCSGLVLAPQVLGSASGRLEVAYALAAQMSIISLSGKPLSASKIMQYDRNVRQVIASGGWDDTTISAYLPPVDFHQFANGSVQPVEDAVWAFAHLAGRHNEQIKQGQHD